MAPWPFYTLAGHLVDEKLTWTRKSLGGQEKICALFRVTAFDHREILLPVTVERSNATNIFIQSEETCKNCSKGRTRLISCHKEVHKEILLSQWRKVTNACIRAILCLGKPLHPPGNKISDNSLKTHINFSDSRQILSQKTISF